MRAPSSTAMVCVGLLAGCGASSGPDKLVSDIEVSFELLGTDSFYEGDHLVEMLVHRDHLYVANSWRGLGVMRLEAEGGLTVTERGDPEGSGDIRCTTLAVHPSSDTLYCSADRPREREPMGPWVERFDLSDPAHPVQLEPFMIPYWAVRDLEVVGDTLLIHQFDEGLWMAQIDGSGGLSGLEMAPVEGNVRHSVALGERVVTALSDPEGQGTLLRLYDPGAGPEGWSALAELPLAGPPLNLRADQPSSQEPTRLLVALGSGGLAIVEIERDAQGLASGLTLEQTLHPPAVVTGAAARDEIVVAATLAGAYAYAYSPSPATSEAPELFGFVAEGTKGEHRDGGMLDAMFYGDELLTSDWTWVERWRLRPEGESVELDLPRGVHVAGEGPVRWRMRSYSEVPLRAELWFRRDHLLDIPIEGPGEIDVELSAKLHAKVNAKDPRARINVRVHDPAVSSDGQALSINTFVLLTREPGEPLPPVIGETFPSLTLADRDAEPFTLPAAERTGATFLINDCFLLFPEYEDLAWLIRSGAEIPRGAPLLISDIDIYLDRFAYRWSLESLPVGFWAGPAPPELAEANAELGDVYQALAIYDLPSGGSTTDYVIEASGEIAWIERMYRGQWPLVPPE